MRAVWAAEAEQHQREKEDLLARIDVLEKRAARPRLLGGDRGPPAHGANPTSKTARPAPNPGKRPPACRNLYKPPAPCALQANGHQPVLIYTTRGRHPFVDGESEDAEAEDDGRG